MTDIDTLKILNKMYDTLSPDDKKAADTVISGEFYKYEPWAIKDPVYYIENFDTVPMLIGEMIRAVKANILKNENKKPNASAKRAVVTKMLKKNTKDALKYTLVKGGRQYAMDNYLLFSFAEVDESLPICPRILEPLYFNTDRLLNDNYRGTRTHELETPTEKMLSARIKMSKDKLYHFGIDLPTVDIRILKDVLRVLPSVKLFWDGCINPCFKEGKLIGRYCDNPLYGRDDAGNEVIIMPIRYGDPEHAGAAKTQI